ncbi:MAG TPA: thioredoxin [Minicystis sp.]|nr:thioredoxin [Minicystis sp.]
MKMGGALQMVIVCPSCASQNRLPAGKLDGKARCGSCKTPLTPLDKPVAVRSATEFDELVASSPLPVLVDFWAAWCGPCRMVAPELERLAHGKSGGLVVAKVDTDALPDLAGRYAISGIPTLVLFRSGREAKRVSGAMPADRIARELAL